MSTSSMGSIGPDRISLKSVIDSDVDDLLAMRGHVFENEATQLYASILLKYLGGQIDELRALTIVSSKMQPDQIENRFVQTCAKLRLEIRTRQIEPSTLAMVHDFCLELRRLTPENSHLIGEVHFLLGLAFEATQEHALCRDQSLQAYHELKFAGIRRKSMRALMNHFAAESRLHPERDFLPDLHFIYREAKRSQDITSIAMTLMNLSIAYNGLNAKSLAMQHANRAVAMAGKNTGNLTYCWTLLHRAELYAQAGCIVESKRDIEAAAARNFPEVKLEIEKLQAHYGLGSGLTNSSLGKEPSQSANPDEKLAIGKLEQKLIDSISQGPKSKQEIARLIYGSRISIESAEGRFHRLLNRVRTRYPGLIVFADGKYRLTEESFLQVHKGS